MSLHRLLLLLLLLVPIGTAGQSYIPERVFTSATGQLADFETLVADAARADVVFVGEAPGDQSTHRIELAFLEGLARRRGEIVLSVELLERDLQESLEHFLMGHTTEAELTAQGRLTPQYASYKPLIDLAIARGWPVIAPALPARVASSVATSGLDVLKTLPEAERALFAREWRCPQGDRYFKRVVAASEPEDRPESPDRAFMVHCLQDETIGESIAQAHTAGAIGGKRPLVVSINRALRSDYSEGVVERTRRRLPDKRLVVVSVLPVTTLDQLAPDEDTRKRADYLVYTVKAK